MKLNGYQIISNILLFEAPKYYYHTFGIENPERIAKGHTLANKFSSGMTGPKMQQLRSDKAKELMGLRKNITHFSRGTNSPTPWRGAAFLARKEIPQIIKKV